MASGSAHIQDFQVVWADLRLTIFVFVYVLFRGGLFGLFVGGSINNFFLTLHAHKTAGLRGSSIIALMSSSIELVDIFSEFEKLAVLFSNFFCSSMKPSVRPIFLLRENLVRHCDLNYRTKCIWLESWIQEALQTSLIEFSTRVTKKNANERPLVRTKRNRIKYGTERHSFPWKFFANSPDIEK